MYVFTYCAWYLCAYKIFEEIEYRVKRRRAFISLIAALLLAPFGIYEHALLWSGNISSMASSQVHVEVVAMYIAYTITDTFGGVVSYPQFFTLVDGWIHHLSTLGFAIISWYAGMSRVFALSMIVEVPTILLQLDRVVADNWTRVLRRTIFPWLFITNRIVLHGMCLWKLSEYPEVPPAYLAFCRVFYTGFTIMNLYWLGLMGMKSWISRDRVEVDAEYRNED